MSASRAPQSPNAVAVIAAAAVTCFVISAVVVIAVAVPDGGRAGSLVALLIGTLAPTIAALATLSGTNRVGQAVGEVKADTAKMLNGVMDEKLNRAIHKAMSERDVSAGTTTTTTTHDE